MYKGDVYIRRDWREEDWRSERLENRVLYARQSGRGNRGIICSSGDREGV